MPSSYELEQYAHVYREDRLAEAARARLVAAIPRTREEEGSTIVVFPLVLRRAFGERAGVVALAAGLAAIGGLLALVHLRVVPVALPAMVVLGPLMVLQYAYWSRCRGGERTTWQYVRLASH